MATPPPPPARDAMLPPSGNGSPAPPILPPPSSGSGGDDEGRTMGSNEGIPGATTGATGGTSKPRSDFDPAKVFAGLVRKVMTKKYTKHGHYFPFKYSHVMCVLKSVKKVFEGEPPLIEMKVPAVVFGDLHGQFGDLCRGFDIFADDKRPGYLNSRYVFVGDYVDRGRQSLEIVMVLFMLKCIYPSQFALLRGNHECRAINKAYGFFAEIKERYLDPKKATELFEMFNEIFSHMPLACIVAGSILCMHGGISSKIKSREDILKVPKPIKDVSTNPIATDLLWADPMIGLSGDIPNKVRGVSVYFGEDTLDQLLVDLKVKVVIRGHQMMMNGFNFFHTHLITVFSASGYYPDKPNRGAVCTIDSSGRIGFKVIIPKTDHPDDLPKLFRGDHDVANDHDTGYVKSINTESPAGKPKHAK